MSEMETPILHISGTLTEKAYTQAIRNWRLRYVALMTIVLPLVLLLAPVCVTLLDWLTNGRNIPTEVLSITVQGHFLPIGK